MARPAFAPIPPAAPWWLPASLRPTRAARNSWPRIAASSAALALVFGGFLASAEPSNGNGSTLPGDLWWLSLYLIVVVPAYWMALRALGRDAGLFVWIPLALLVGLAELVWYGLYCAGSW